MKKQEIKELIKRVEVEGMKEFENILKKIDSDEELTENDHHYLYVLKLQSNF